MAEAALVQERYAMETRAQVLRLASADAAVRRGESDRFEIGRAASSDAVEGSESLGVGGDLVEHLHSRVVDAMRVETHVDGGLAMHSHSDLTLLGGAMAETHAGPVLVVAGMSDDLLAGGGIRAAAVDLRLAGLLGAEERIGTTHTDQSLIEAYITQFEYEYGNGIHVANFARFSGAVHATVASGFRPLFQVMHGVRNLAAHAAPAVSTAPISVPPLSAPSRNTGLLAATPKIAPSTGTVASVGDGAFDAERLDDFSQYLKRADAAAGSRPDAAAGFDAIQGDNAGRSAGTADSLADLRRLTQADVDESLAHLRARANLPDDAGMDQVIDFLHRTSRGEIGDLEVQRAALALQEDLAVATRPFLQPLVARGIPGDDLDALALDELRPVFARELQQARAGGDVNAAADLQAAFVGFDRVVFRSASAFVERFADLATPENAVPTALASVRLPSSDAASAKLAPNLVAPLTSRLSDLQQSWADDPTKIGLLELAMDEVRHGNNPLSTIDGYVRMVIRCGGEMVGAGELDALQEVVASIRLMIDKVVNDTAAEVAELAMPDEFDMSQLAYDAQTWRDLFPDDSLAEVSADAMLRGGAPDADVRNLSDLTLDDAAGVVDRGATYGDARIDEEVGGDRSRAQSVRGTASDVAFPSNGNYPFVPPRLPADVDARALSRALRGYQATLTNPGTGSWSRPKDAAASDALVRAKHRAVTDALGALGRGHDPVAVLDARIRAARRHTGPPAWTMTPSGLASIDGEADVLREVRYVVDDLLEQHRSGAPPADVGTVDNTVRINALRQHSDAAGTAPKWDYVTIPAMRPSGLQADILLRVDDCENIAGLVAADIHRDDLDPAGGACTTVVHRGRQQRLDDGGQLEAAAAWTILTDDPHRIDGFLHDDRRGRLPVLRATRAEQKAIDKGDIVVRIIDVETFKTYDDFEMATGLADDFSRGRLPTGGPVPAHR